MTESPDNVGTPPTVTEEPVKFVADARLISILGEQLMDTTIRIKKTHPDLTEE